MSHQFMPIKPAIIDWDDSLPRSREFDDVYFSKENGFEESNYVFIEANRLTERFESFCNNREFIIGELGFGSGLNFLIVWDLWLKKAPEESVLHFISCEKSPLLSHDLEKSLSKWPVLEHLAQEFIAQYPVLTPGNHHLIFANGRVKLTLMLGDAFECYRSISIPYQSSHQDKFLPYVDAWFLDGFSPAKNPDMWDENLLKIIALLSSKMTTLSTFSASGLVKKNLEGVGFHVSKIKGYGRKREMITAQFLSSHPSFKLFKTPWAYSSNPVCQNKKAIVVGAGLAGCSIAYELALKGWKIILLDAAQSIADGASGNEKAVIFPNISAYKSPLTSFMLSAFLYATKKHKNFINERVCGEQHGILLLLNQYQKEQQDILTQWLVHYPALGQIVDSKRASALAGVPVECDSLWIPQAGWLNSKQLCEHLASHPNISYQPGVHAERLDYIDGMWCIEQYKAPTLVLACGIHVKKFNQTNFLPIKGIRGQLTSIRETASSKGLKMPVCGDGHVLPAYNGKHLIGATYHLNEITPFACQKDNELNLLKLNQMPISVEWGHQIVSHWSGIRAVSPDYLPFVGSVPKKNEFLQTYASLRKNAKFIIDSSPPVYKGLYVLAGFGSRGLTSIPLCASWLSSVINNEFLFLPDHLIESFSPARFLRRQIITGT